MKTIEKHIILTNDERGKLLKVLSSGKPNEILYANILLMSDKGFAPKKVAEALNTTKQTVNTAKQRFFEQGVEKCLVRKNAGKAPYASKITGDVEARIIALACSTVPDGRNRWTLRLLADKSVELQIANGLSHDAIGKLLKKHNLSLI